ncbi:MAG TPA: S53 family peptidase [Actinocrinis sp.]|nr:S53 family peptidase [Actinocrinis sp.]
MSNARLKRVAIAVPATVALVAASLTATAVQASASTASAFTALQGSQPTFATPSADRGQVSPGAAQTARIYLASQNPRGMAAYAQAVSTVNGPEYGRYLSVAQAQARFGPSAAAVAEVKAWVASVGLKVTSQTPQYIEVSGTVGSAQKAFGTAIHQYATNSGLVDAITGDIQIPTSLATSILGVSGLSGQVAYDKPTLVKQSSVTGSATTKSAVKPAVAKPAAGDPVDPECSTSYGQNSSAGTGLPAGYNGATAVPYSECNYVPSQLRQAYGITGSGLSGKGVTVAIVDAYASSTMPADANEYATNHGDAAFAPGQYTQVTNPATWNSEAACGGPAGWAPEESLDIEMVHGLAPGANVEYIGADSCNDDDLLAGIASVVNTHSASVISNSWGEIMHGTTGTGPDSDTITPQEIQAYEQVFQQAAIEGIGVQFSAGDCGDSSPVSAVTGASCDPTTTEAQANWPDSDVWATSVGGTALFTSTAAGKYDFESTMGDLLSLPVTDAGGAITAWSPLPGEYYFGGGGGTSQDFTEPWYQYGVVPSSLSHTLATGAHSATAQRVTPDVAMQGDLVNATAVGISDGSPYSEAGYGGTSVSSPEWAAMVADGDQALGHPIGFENPLIYFSSYFGVFTDVTANPAAAHGGTKGALQEVLDFGDGNVTLWGLGHDSSLTASRGYDDATGVGAGSGKFLTLLKLLR